MPCILLGLLSPTHTEVSVFVVFVLITICRSDTGVVCVVSVGQRSLMYILMRQEIFFRRREQILSSFFVTLKGSNFFP